MLAKVSPKTASLDRGEQRPPGAGTPKEKIDTENRGDGSYGKLP